MLYEQVGIKLYLYKYIDSERIPYHLKSVNHKS